MHKHTVITANGNTIKRNSKNRIYLYVLVETMTHEGKITEKGYTWSSTLDRARSEKITIENRRASNVAKGWTDPAYVFTYTIMQPTVVSK